MKQPLDKFSKQASLYKQYRPTYPAALYESLLEHCPQRFRCWDVATGNGQVAVELAKYFLITVAQAMHWLDAEAFHLEVKRVGRPGGASRSGAMACCVFIPKLMYGLMIFM